MTLGRSLLIVLALVLALSSAAAAQSKKGETKRGSDAAASAASPDVKVSIESVLDRRTTRDFPRSELSITFKLEGADAGAVQSARATLTKATDDTGRSVLQSEAESRQGPDLWQEAREGGPPTPKVDLASPSRKAKKLTEVEGVLQMYLPSRDPASTVAIEKILAKRDKPLTVPALASRHVRLAVLSKAGLEREKKEAEAKKKAEAAKKGDKEGGLDQMAQAMGDALVRTFEALFLNAGDNDLILRVDDPEKKIFSFGLAAPNGAPIRSYGVTDLENYRILRMLEPIPPAATLQVLLKTPKSFGEVPFSLSNLRLP